VVAESLRLKPKGIVYWSRHLSLTFSNPRLYFYEYPVDTQRIYIRFESYAFPSEVLQLNFAHPPVEFYEGAATSAASITLNPTWQYDSYTAQVASVNNAITAAPRYFSQGVVTLNFTRISDGVLIRVAVPILILLMVAALMFWGYYEHRFGGSISLLLALSALLLVVSSSIPLVGYLTLIDSYSLTMYMMLFFCCCAHQIVDQLHQKCDRHPLRGITMKIIETSFKCLMIPALVIIYFGFFSNEYSRGFRSIMYTFIAVFFAAMVTREWVSFRIMIKKTAYLLVLKFQNGKKELESLSAENLDGLAKRSDKILLHYQLSKVERLVLNLYFYGKFSWEGLELPPDAMDRVLPEHRKSSPVPVTPSDMKSVESPRSQDTATSHDQAEIEMSNYRYSHQTNQSFHEESPMHHSFVISNFRR
jgi:hypothetical protein